MHAYYILMKKVGLTFVQFDKVEIQKKKKKKNESSRFQYVSFILNWA